MDHKKNYILFQKGVWKGPKVGNFTYLEGILNTSNNKTRRDLEGDYYHIGNLSMKLRAKEKKSDLLKIEVCKYIENM